MSLKEKLEITITLVVFSVFTIGGMFLGNMVLSGPGVMLGLCVGVFLFWLAFKVYRQIFYESMPERDHF